MMGAKGKCRKDPVDEDTDQDQVDVASVSETLQVVSISPASIEPGKTAAMKVYGAGFASGAVVDVGAVRIAPVQFVDSNTLSFDSPALPVGTHDVVVTNPDGADATLRAGLTVRGQAASGDTSCNAMVMYFELDSASLSATARGALDQAMPCLREKGRIELQGHADERGTTDYNLALGNRRAQTVQRYLLNQGIPMDRLPVLSYGEERPADPGHNEAAWAKNRRVEMYAR
jgi:peptidoglycan-associated lipoprotein